MSAWIAVLLIAMLFTTGTAWAGLTFTVVTEPAEAGEGGSYEMRKISEDVYSDRQFIVIPEEGFTVKSVIWTDKDRIPETLTEIGMVGEGGTIELYYTAPNASGEVVITFEMKKKRCGKTSSDKVYWAFSNNEKGLLDISYKSGGSEMADYERYEDTPWWQYHETIKTLVVNEGVTTIGKNAFGRLGALTSVSLPNSLTSIGEKAFEGCNSLTSLKIPSGVTYIEKNAFDYCSGLMTVNVYAATPPELGSNVFDDNASDRKIYVPYAALDDYKDAYGWSNYKDDILPLAATLPYTLIIESNYVDGPNVEISVSYDLSLTENNHHYTLNATYLEAQFNRSGGHTIVGWATTPGSDVVYAPGSTIVLTENPTTIYTVWDDTDKWSVTKSKGSDVYDVLTIKSVGAMADYEEYEDTPWWQYHETIKTLVVNEGVTTIGKNAFGRLGALTSVSLPNSLTSIGEKAFDSCYDLTSLEIPPSVTEIKKSAFNYCSGLTSIDIPASVTSIETLAFNDCFSLKTVNVYAATPPELGGHVFDGNASDHKIYVPYAALDDYKDAYGWSNYKDDILPLAATLPYTLIIESNYVDGPNVEISVSYDLSLTENNHHYTLNATYLETQFNRSGDHTILGWATSPTGDVVYGPNSTIVLTENPTTIYTVWDDTENWIVTKSKGSDVYDVLTIKNNSEMADYERYEDTPWWQYHETIKTLVVNEGVTTIGKDAFGHLGALTSVSLPHSLTSIGEKAFDSCSGLTSLKIPSSVTVIGNGALMGCDGLTSIDIPASVTSIKDDAFRSCTSLKTVNVYAITPPKLGHNVFDGNAAGRKVYVPSAALDAYKKAGGWSDYKDDILPLEIPYIDADGNTAYCYDFTPLDGSETRLNNNVDTNNDGTPDQGWYVVSSDISYTNTLILDGDIHLILCDGNTMSVNTNVVSLDGYTTENANLTIYGQTNQTGRLEAHSESIYTIFLEYGNYTQYGGDVYLSNIYHYDARVLVAFTDDAVGGNVTLIRGKLTASAKASSGTAIAAGNNVNILGGQLDAQGGTEGEYACGILAFDGNITLGWTTATDRIKASSYHAHGTIKIADGQTLYDEDGVAHTSANLGSIDGKTLRGVLEKRGDANGDGSITVTDIAVVVNCILQLANNGGYSPYGADANGDGQVTVTDIGVIVDKILGSPSPTPPEGGEPQ